MRKIELRLDIYYTAANQLSWSLHDQVPWTVDLREYVYRQYRVMRSGLQQLHNLPLR
jgi:hypothetical protein